ncbi:S-layer family protein [Desmonostoc muscorum LEGE 12446]|uniref:Filamentous hemagglutinin N-terminal domain-containing protein n=1 Tax=Desmonostoc muscorum LEGE 12446 TaxID=1828758 RepID=A0A8J7ABX9_DESMC|nr:filamentous hemagglutinin N-terminal domain-containing protein [Desmonostoc muscorum]MCF2148678.1 S-layer family protein [Desmonostoc muscorum LEGE 12446]
MFKFFSQLLLFGLALSALSSYLFRESPVLAEITADSTLGSESSILIQGVEVKGAIGNRIDGGAVRGANLFHSFGEFSIGDGQRVYFSNPTGIENILTRVTGNNPSNILGTLGVLGNANLFLINPNGIVFGSNARLDIGGSFLGTTANGIKFGNQGFFSASTPEIIPLLSINPSALFFNQISAGTIETRSVAPAGLDGSGEQIFGLRVADGRSLLLLGSDINLNGGSLNALGGRIDLGGLAGPGSVELRFVGNNLSMSFPDSVPRANVSLTDNAKLNVTAENGGSIAIAGRNIDIAGESIIQAGIGFGLGNFGNQAGEITLNATDLITLRQSSTIQNTVEQNATGNSGDIKVTTGSFSVSDGSQVIVSTLGQGNAGNVTIQARDMVTLDGLNSEYYSTKIVSNIAPRGVGQAGNINIQTGSLSMINTALLDSGTFGQGSAGNITIQAREAVLLDRSDIASAVSRRAIFGKGGNIEITADSLSVVNGSQLSSSTFGKGDAGNVTIQTYGVNGVVFDGVSSEDEFPSGAFSTVSDNAVGKGGNIQITAESLFVSNGAQLQVATIGQGDAGNITIKTRDRLSFNGTASYGLPSGAFSSVEPSAVGKGGNIQITTGSLSVTNGAGLNSQTRGKGDAGSILIKAQDLVSFDGVSILNFSSGAFSTVSLDAQGKGGDIEIIAGSLSISNRARLNAQSNGMGKAGNILVTANTFDAASGGKLLTLTTTTNPAGDIILKIRDRLTLAGDGTGMFANTTADATGNSGNIFIDPKVMIIRDGAKIAVDNQGAGIGGTINIQAGKLTLDNQAVISAETASNTGGDIQLQLTDLLLLRRNSIISTTAGTTQGGGNGGNIAINSPFIVAAASENNDIMANAFSGNGGKVNITARRIFGLIPRSRSDLERLLATNDPDKLNPRSLPTSDITAISQANPSFSGQVVINTSDVEPSSGLVNLPTNLVDASQLIAQNCRNGGEATANQQSEFVVTGRGGLPPNPIEPLSSDAIWQDLQPHALLNEKVSGSKEEVNLVSETPSAIVEAQGWVIAADGSITLVAQAPTTTPHNSSLTPVNCPLAQN